MRTFGQTGWKLSPIGLGLAALGRPGYINLGHSEDIGDDKSVEAMERNTHAVLDAAWARGVRYFDAARSYGGAESFLASWLASRGIAPDAVTVGSKWGYVYTAGWRTDATEHEVKDHSLANLRRQLEESRDLLGGHLRLYQIHSATLETGVLDDVEVLRALARAKESGLAIGLSTSGPRQAETVRKALEVRVDGVRLFDSVQSTWNLIERSAGDALADAHAAGLGVIVKEALANGRLTARATAADASGSRFLEIASVFGVAPDALAIATVLRQPWVDVVLSGASTVAQLESNLRAIELTIDESLWTRLEALVEPPEDYWRHRKSLAWN